MIESLRNGRAPGSTDEDDHRDDHQDKDDPVLSVMLETIARYIPQGAVARLAGRLKVGQGRHDSGDGRDRRGRLETVHDVGWFNNHDDER